jgi:hypothetical protein
MMSTQTKGEMAKAGLLLAILAICVLNVQVGDKRRAIGCVLSKPASVWPSAEISC